MRLVSFVNATELDVWADHRDAQGKLPKLVRRLVLTRGDDLRRIDFRADEGVSLGGWDGLVETDSGNAFVPAGVSAWELSTNANVTSKANDDYSKRTKDPGGVDPKHTTFVFVTPRRWPGKQAWVSSKQQDGHWKEVRAYDADNLETWLELAPSVHLWMSELLGKRIDGATDLTNWWDVFSQATNPTIQEALLRGGREDDVAKTTGWIEHEPSSLSVASDSAEESVAFLYSALGTLSEADRDRHVARTVVISDEAAWNSAITSDNPLLLIPLVDGLGAASATRNGHHVYVPLTKGAVGLEDALVLSRLKRVNTREVLEEMGVPEGQLEELTGLARRNLLSFRRRLGRSLQSPAWSKPHHFREVLPAMLAGRWDSQKEGDKEVVASFGGSTYEEVETKLHRWEVDRDPPARRIGTRWLINSHDDAWRLIRGSVNLEDMQRFKEACKEVLGEVNPALELPPEKRWASAVYGVSSKYSEHLRRGLASTLAIMGAYSDSRALADGSFGQDHANRIVRSILSDANEDKTGRVWSSIADVLPLFAEAAPEVFLDAAETDLVQDAPALTHLFQDDKSAPAMFVHSPHPHILWALETLAWNPVLLVRATMCLGRLVEIDPGGNRGNRPASTLRQIFLDWHPQTTAPVEKRFEVLDALRERHPGVAWDLLIALLPRSQDNSFPSSHPRWRDWKPDEDRGVTLGERLRCWEEVLSRLLQDVGLDAARWDELLSNTTNLPKELHEKVVAALDSVDPEDLEDRDRSTIRDSLRRIVMTHRKFASADWAMQVERVDQLEALSGKFVPVSPIYEHAWLFKEKTDVLDFPGEGFKEQEIELAKARQRAVEAVLAAEAIEGVLTMLTEVENSYELGRSLGNVGVHEQEAAESLYCELDSSDQAKVMFALGYVRGRYEVGGWEWVKEVTSGWSEWNPKERGQFLLSLPQEERVWALAEGADEATASEYWASFRPYGLSNADEHVIAAEKLLQQGRPHAGVQILGLYLGHSSVQPPASFVCEALEQAARTKPPEKTVGSLFSHNIGELLDFLENSGDVEQTRLVNLEWAYLPLLTHGERPPKLLHAELAANLGFFAEVVSVVYRAKGEEPKESTEDERIKATLANELLINWHGIPGKSNEGEIDGAALGDWVTKARESLAATGRGVIGDHIIGPILANSPMGTDDVWPHEAVRDVLEQTVSKDLDNGFITGVHNNRGVTTRGPWEGGDQERDLAEKYEQYATAINEKWPRVARVLRRIADSYQHDSRREDQDSDIRQDLGE